VQISRSLFSGSVASFGWSTHASIIILQYSSALSLDSLADRRWKVNQNYLLRALFPLAATLLVVCRCPCSFTHTLFSRALVSSSFASRHHFVVDSFSAIIRVLLPSLSVRCVITPNRHRVIEIELFADLWPFTVGFFASICLIWGVYAWFWAIFSSFCLKFCQSKTFLDLI
jgi:hypothetical protein